MRPAEVVAPPAPAPETCSGTSTMERSMAEIHDISQRQPQGNPGKPGFCETPHTQAIFRVLDACQKNGWLGMIVGEPGVGKTTAIKEYAKCHSEPLARAFYCRMPKAARSPQAALHCIARAVGADAPPNVSAIELLEIIVDHLAMQDPGLLIVDEAQNMSVEVLECVRDIYDTVPAGVMFVGNPTLEARLSDGASRRSGTDLAQLRSRVSARLKLTKVLPEDVKAICASYGVTGARELSRMRDLANAKGGGGLRRVTSILDKAHQQAAAAGDEAITHDHLQYALKITGVA